MSHPRPPTPEPIRVVRLTDQPPVRSQTIYHAVAYEMAAGGPDTILVISPRSPYVSIGYHQQGRLELDLDACASRHLPIVRREVGGGAVYLDADQVFVNWVMRSDRLPRTLTERYARYVAPLVATYQRYGIPATYRPVNDVHVAGRKIGGTGAARIGLAELVVGSLMFDFDTETMAQVLRVSSEKMRDKVAGALRDYMTSMRRELTQVPDREAVIATYLSECARTLGRPLVPGELTEAELARAARLDELMARPDWVFRDDGRAPAGVRIHAGVGVHAADRKTPAGLLRVTTVVRDAAVLDVVISGDVTVLPQDSLAKLEARLLGVAATAEAISAVVADWFTACGVDAPGLSPDELSDALVAALPELSG